MKERQAKKQLENMLQSFTVGSILHLLADLLRNEGHKAARASGDGSLYRQCKQAESTLFVVGLGLDAVLPR